MRHRAFTLINTLITVAVMAIVAAAVLPSIARGNQINVTGAAYLVASDLEYAQSISLAEPDNPAIVRFDLANAAYWIARADEPDTPILRSNGRDAYHIQFGAGDASAATNVAISVTGATDDTIAFDGFGRLAVMNDIIVNLSGDGSVRQIRVDADTGAVTIE